MKTIPVFFSVDDNYVPWLSVALKSLIHNASRQYRYELVILHEGLPEESLMRLKSLSEPGFTIRPQLMTERFERIRSDFEGNRLHTLDRFTMTIFFRLFLPDMFPQYDRGIYLDSDIVVPGDISELFETDLGGNLIAACPDYSIQDIPPFVSYVTDYVGMDRSLDYINSGVLLMDFDGLRKAGMGRRFMEVLDRWQFNSIAPDQDYINSMCKGRIKYLDACWDAMPNDKSRPLDHPKLIHYNLFSKPWLRDGVQYEEYFWRWVPECGFADEIRRYKEAYTDEERRQDGLRAESMMQTALKLQSSAGHSFRTVFGDGLEQRL